MSPVAGVGSPETALTTHVQQATSSRADTPRRVVAVIDAANLSGPGRQLAALCSAIREQGVELHVVTFRRNGRAPSAFVTHLESVGADVTVLPENGPADLALVGRLREVLESLDPEIVQTHGYRPTALMYMLRRQGGRWPWIVYYHGATTENWKVRLYHWLDQRLMPSADRIVVMSSRHEQTAPARARGRVRVLHNAAIPERIDPSVVARSEHTLDGFTLDGPVLGVVGRLSSEKGVDIFLDAARLLADRGVVFSALIVGDGPDRAALQQMCTRLGLDDRVRFVGAVGAVSPVYRRLDMLVIPSRSEGLPNVLLEALAADLPCVATDVGAIPEVLTDPNAGILVAPGSPAALADGIVAALPLRDSAEAADARHAAVDRFSLAHRVDRHLALYREVIAVRHDTRGPVATASRR